MLRLCLLAVAALVLVAGARGAVSQTIYAYFDVDGNIQFRYSDSSNVGSTIPPGTYTINLNNNGADDLAVDHIFHLSGPGVDYKAANVDTTAVFSVTFQAGATYRVFDDLNPTISQTIVATSAPAPSTPSVLPPAPVTSSTKPTAGGIVGSDAAAPFRGSLEVTVSAAGKLLALTHEGLPVRGLRQGRYTIVVADGSRAAGLTVESPRGRSDAVTTRPFVGKRHVTLTLTPGRWLFFSGGPKTGVPVS